MNESNHSVIAGRTHKASCGVVLLAHGSQRGSHTITGLEEVVRQLQLRLGENVGRVVLACLEFIEPNLVQAVSSLADEGFRRVVVMPFLLGQGTHASDDLQEEIGHALVENPSLKIHATQPLGCDPSLIEIVVDRVIEDSHAADGVSNTKGVLMVKAGTRHPTEDHQWFVEMGGMVETSLGRGHAVGVAQSHFGEPTMEAAASHLIKERGASSIVCVPYIFFPGLILTRNIEGGIEELREAYPNVPFSITPTLGVDDRLVNLTAQRIIETMSSLGGSMQTTPESFSPSLSHRAD